MISSIYWWRPLHSFLFRSFNSEPFPWDFFGLHFFYMKKEYGGFPGRPVVGTSLSNAEVAVGEPDSHLPRGQASVVQKRCCNKFNKDLKKPCISQEQLKLITNRKNENNFYIYLYRVGHDWSDLAAAAYMSILFLGFSRQEYWSGLPFPFPVDHILSDLSTMTCLSWVAPHGMA